MVLMGDGGAEQRVRVSYLPSCLDGWFLKDFSGVLCEDRAEGVIRTPRHMEDTSQQRRTEAPAMRPSDVGYF
jgi:hypothetical protein